MFSHIRRQIRANGTIVPLVYVCVGVCTEQGIKLLLLGRGERGGRGRDVNAVSVFPPTPKNQEQCNTTVGNRSLLQVSYGSTASKKKDPKKYFKNFVGCYFNLT